MIYLWPVLSGKKNHKLFIHFCPWPRSKLERCLYLPYLYISLISLPQAESQPNSAHRYLAIPSNWTAFSISHSQPFPMSSCPLPSAHQCLPRRCSWSRVVAPFSLVLQAARPHLYLANYIIFNTFKKQFSQKHLNPTVLLWDYYCKLFSVFFTPKAHPVPIPLTITQQWALWSRNCLFDLSLSSI